MLDHPFHRNKPRCHCVRPPTRAVPSPCGFDKHLPPRHIANIMGPVFNRPVPPPRGLEFRSPRLARSQTGDAIGRLGADPSGLYGHHPLIGNHSIQCLPACSFKLPVANDKWRRTRPDHLEGDTNECYNKKDMADSLAGLLDLTGFPGGALRQSESAKSPDCGESTGAVYDPLVRC